DWHLFNRGEWPDPGILKVPDDIQTLRAEEEPPFHRVPLDEWDEARGLSLDVRHYPIYEEFYNSTLLDPGVHTPQFNLSALPFSPGYYPRRDRLGLLYGSARIFDTWPSWAEGFDLRVEEATNLIRIPQTGHWYQKLYLGPLPITTGWTMGSLIKAFSAQRCPGHHAVVALKLHAGRRTGSSSSRGSSRRSSRRAKAAAEAIPAPYITQLPGVREDLLEIALNLKGVAFRTREAQKSGRVRVRVVGPRVLHAGMIKWPSFVAVANPEHFLAKVEKGGILDLEMKLEWGRGCWLADLHGLYREEEGVDSRCFKRRRIWEVDHLGFYPTSCLFGCCTMMRVAVHKLLGTRFCQDRQESTNPTEQLVLEIWTDRSSTPKQLLAFALQDLLAWLLHMREQLVRDADFEAEEEDLRATWKNIEAWHAARRQQELLGGPPLVVLEEAGGEAKLDPGPAGKSFSMPHNRPPPCPVHPVAWLKQQLAEHPYDADNYSDVFPPRKPAKESAGTKSLSSPSTTSSASASHPM
ncbi:LOW QUALITY PROTEIN: uncharacterized protein LOC131479316, partial [Ochotona princeps]|uniref:LOW QUALITY PROTEIN: uncharacterized protein LOC131479316 n=1 Tax=Ochotona princeps TaxID=9978 RepID=UPI0027155196